MAVIAWLVVGCGLGLVAYALAAERLPLGLAGAAFAGALGGLLGATSESLIEGSRRFELDPASVAGAAFGAIVLLALVVRAGGGSGTPERWRDVA